MNANSNNNEKHESATCMKKQMHAFLCVCIGFLTVHSVETSSLSTLSIDLFDVKILMNLSSDNPGAPRCWHEGTSELPHSSISFDFNHVAAFFYGTI